MISDKTYQIAVYARGVQKVMPLGSSNVCHLIQSTYLFYYGSPPVRGDSSRALAGGISPVQADKLWYNFFYTTFISVDPAQYEIFRAKVFFFFSLQARWYKYGYWLVKKGLHYDHNIKFEDRDECSVFYAILSITRPRGYKTFFVLNSVEHEILNAHK